MAALPGPPARLKVVQSFLKVAQDVERVNPVVSYWLRLYSTETALKIDSQSPECSSFLATLISWLEKFKSSHKDSDEVNNITVGQAHFENFALNLFNKADTLDREGTADKNTVRIFYMAAVLFEAMAVFGSLTEDISQKAKYAKFKAAYIQKCLKSGQTPKPGPIDGSDLEGTTEGVDSAEDTKPSSSILNIPGVPTDADGNSSSAKSKEPFIMNPSTPPSRPLMPPVLPPGAGYQMNDPMGSSRPQANPHAPSSSNNATTTCNDSTKSTINETKFVAGNGAQLKPEDILQSQKYCKFANSALQYDDIPTAIANLEKALKLLTTGQNTG